MDAIIEKILQYKKWIVTVFLVLTVVFTAAFFKVKINYNMADYLPDDANSTIALDTMTEEFDRALPNCDLMVENVSIMEAIDLREKLEELDTVEEVTWLDDVTDIKVPIETQNLDNVTDYYKDGDARFSIALKDGQERDGIKEIKSVIGEDAILAGNAVEQADSQNLAMKEAVRAVGILGPLIILILILSASSWIEPFIYLLVIGAAVLINLGSELFRGEISYVTLAVAPMLQLAVSLDYAVFLSESYKEHRKTAKNDFQAMKRAIKASAASILASALTTVLAFLTMVTMDFKIGPDMGISLVKGVLLSLIASLTLLPAAIMMLNRWIDKTTHRSFMPSFQKPGKAVVKIKFPVFAVVCVAAMVCFLAQGKNAYTYGSGDAVGNTPSARLIDETFGETNTMVVLVPKGEPAKEMLLAEEFEDMDHVTDVISYATEVGVTIPPQYLSKEVTDNFYSENYAQIIVYSNLPDEGEEAFALVDDIRNTAARYYGDTVLTCGQSANLYDMKDTVTSDNNLVNLLTIAAIYLVLLFTLKSWLLPIALIFIIKMAIWINMAVPFFTDTALAYIGYLVVSTVQMGATIDYAILLTNTYLENRKYMKLRPALENTMQKTMPAIMVSAVILAVTGFSLAIVSSNGLVQSLGILIGRGALIPLILVNICLPAVLALLDRIIPYTTLHTNFYKETIEPVKTIVEQNMMKNSLLTVRTGTPHLIEDTAGGNDDLEKYYN